jgi:hypothetical protein
MGLDISAIMFEVIALIIVEYFLVGVLPSLTGSIAGLNWTVLNGTTAISLSWIGFIINLVLYLLLLGGPLVVFYFMFRAQMHK